MNETWLLETRQERPTYGRIEIAGTMLTIRHTACQEKMAEAGSTFRLQEIFFLANSRAGGSRWGSID